jgi:hypothetical protein
VLHCNGEPAALKRPLGEGPVGAALFTADGDQLADGAFSAYNTMAM